MSNTQNNENQNTGGTIKPIIHKTVLRPHRPQTTGYQQEELPETNNSTVTTQSKPTPLTTAKPSLNVDASVYIPKSIASNASAGNVAQTTQEKNIPSPNQPASNLQGNVLSASTQAFTPKIANAYNQSLNVNAPMNAMGQNYNMGQSKFCFLFFSF